MAPETLVSEVDREEMASLWMSGDDRDWDMKEMKVGPQQMEKGLGGRNRQASCQVIL